MSKDIELSARISEIVTFYFANPDYNYTELSKQFKVSVARISQIMSHPKVLAAYPILARKRIKSLVPQAVGKLEKLMNQRQNLAISERVVSKILDSEKVLEPSTHKIIHEIQLKSVKELQDIVEGSKTLPRQVIDAEIMEDEAPQ